MSALLSDLLPVLRLPATGQFAASARIAHIVASGQLPSVAGRAASGLLLYRYDRLSDLVPALLTFRKTQVPLTKFRSRSSDLLVRAQLTEWEALAARTVDDLFRLSKSRSDTVLDILNVAVKEAAHALLTPPPTQTEEATTDEPAPREDEIAESDTPRSDGDDVLNGAAAHLLKAVRLLASWAVREGQGDRLSDLVALTSRDLPPDVERTLVDAGLIEVTTLAYPRLTRADLTQIAEDVLKRLPDDHRMIAERRILPVEPDTLEHVGRDLGVTRERVRQIQRKVDDQLAELLQNDLSLPLRWRAAALAAILGVAVPARSPLIDKALREVTRDAGQPEPLTTLLVFLAGPYRAQNGWWVRTAARIPAIADLLAAMGESRHMSLENVATWMTAHQVNPQLLPDWIEIEPKLMVQDGLVLDWSGSAVEKCVTLLKVWRHPASAEDLVAAVNEGHNPRGIRQRLFNDRRFMRVNRTHWSLREWGGEEYTGISEEIEQRILEWGGRAKLTDLVNVLVQQFGVAAGSVRVYAEAPKFVIEDGWVRLRTAMDALEARQTLSTARGLYRCSPSSWAYVLRVDPEVLRGSGRNCPEVFARALPLTPGEECTFDGPAGQLRITWPNTSAFGPSLGSTRGLASHVWANAGDYIRIQFDLSRRTYETFRIAQALLNSWDSCSSLRLLTGLSLHKNRLTEGVAEGVGTTPAELVGVLRRRGDDQVADLLPPPTDAGLDDALADLAALFDTD